MKTNNDIRLNQEIFYSILVSIIMLSIFLLNGCNSNTYEEEYMEENINTNNYINFIDNAKNLIDSAPNNTDSLAFNFDFTISQNNFEEENQLNSYKSNIIDNAKNILTSEINKSVSAGYMISAILYDINTNKIITYNSQVPYTCQSCIKAPYITSVIEKTNSVYFENKTEIDQLIKYSDNYAYENLRKKYGDKEFDKWCSDMGIYFLPEDNIYARNATTKDFTKLWIKMYNFIMQHDYNQDQLYEYVSLYNNTKCSAISEQLSNKYKVYTKAGWEHGLEYLGFSDDENISSYEPEYNYTDGNPLNDEVATNDAGIVYSSCGPYILTIFTSYPAQPRNIKSIVGAFDDLHTAIFSN